MNKSVVALSVEGSALKFLNVEGDIVKDWGTVPFNPNFVRNGAVINPEGIARVVKNLLTSRKIAKAKLVCVMPGYGVINRQMRFPAIQSELSIEFSLRKWGIGVSLNRVNLDQIVRREAERILGISPENTYIYWYPLPDDGNTRVNVFAVPKERLDHLIETTRIAGVKSPMVMVELKTLALVKSINKKDAIIVNSDTDGIDLLIVIGGLLMMIRSLFLGTIMSPQTVIDELARTLAFYNESYRENQENHLDSAIPIHLTGDLDDGLSDKLTALSGITGRKVTPLAPPLSCPPGLPLASFMASIGAILRGSEKPHLIKV